MCRTIFNDQGQAVGVACSRGDHRRGKVQACGRCDQPGQFLCDFIVKPQEKDIHKRTCSSPLCKAHAFVGPGADVHLCFIHRNAKESEVT